MKLQKNGKKTPSNNVVARAASKKTSEPGHRKAITVKYKETHHNYAQPVDGYRYVISPIGYRTEHLKAAGQSGVASPSSPSYPPSVTERGPPWDKEPFRQITDDSLLAKGIIETRNWVQARDEMKSRMKGKLAIADATASSDTSLRRTNAVRHVTRQPYGLEMKQHLASKRPEPIRDWSISSNFANGGIGGWESY